MPVCNLRVKRVAEEWERRRREQEDNGKARAETRGTRPARAFSLHESLGSLTIAQRLNSFATSRRASFSPTLVDLLPFPLVLSLSEG